MIIEQVEALKAWLTAKLSPICDAEPSALAKYVCALVKKDKPEGDLRDICLDQLDVFLQQKTKPFVDELFETLKSKSYISSEEKKPPAPPATNKRPLAQTKEKDEPPKKKAPEVTSSAADKENNPVKETKEKEATTADTPVGTVKETKETTRDVKDTKDAPRESKEPRALSREGKDRDSERDRDRRDSWKDERNKDGIRDARDIIREREGRDTREVREPRDRDVRDRDREYRRRRSRSRSYSPRRNYMDDRVRRRFDDRYNRYSPERRWGRRRSWSRSPRRNRSPIGRPRSRSPRPRSRSPRLRSRSPRGDRLRSFRSRTRSRSRSPRARSWSRTETGGAGFVRSRSPQARQPDSRGSTPILDNDYSALISSSTNELPSVSSTVGPHPIGANQRPMMPVGHGTRSRCIDFEEKGFCMMGDMCPFDHGTDPVVVEDVPIPSVVPGAPAPPGVVSGPGLLPPVPMAVRMSMQHRPPNMVEPYMPEAPGMRGPPPHFMRGMPPPHLRPPPPGMMMPRPPMDRMMGPPPREVMIQHPPPPVLDDDDLDPLIGDKEPSRIVIPAKRPFPPPLEENPAMMMQMGPPPPRMPHINQHHHMFGQNPAVVRMSFPPPPPQVPQMPQMSAPPRKNFDFNRLGGRGGQRHNSNRPPFKTGNLTLEVRKIPAELNNIAKINEHFGKFGNLTNIQVKFQGDASAALITFSNNGEATAAYKSPEPVFNNRFIKLFWHNPNKSDDGSGASGEGAGHDLSLQRPGGRAGDGIDHPSLVLPVRSTIPPAHKLFLDNTKTSQPTALTAEATSTTAPETGKPGDKSSIVYTSSVGHLKKTVFNASAAPGAPPKAKTPGAVTSPTTLSKPSDFVSRIEAIKRAEENRKIATVKQAELEAKKQELLAKQIQQQKLLIETLDKKKGTMSEVEKSSLLKSLKVISDAIDKVKYATGAPKKSTFQAPLPSQMKFVSQDQVQPPASFAPTPYSYGRGRGWAGAGQSSTWSSRGRGRGATAAVGRTHLDNRPKTIEVKDFEMEELEEVKLHFQKFGEFEKVELVESIPSIFITYSARPSAEMAVSQGRNFKSKVLTVRWNQMMQKLPRTESVQSSDLEDEDLSVTLGSLEEEALRNIGAADKSDASTTVPSIPSQTTLPDTVTSPETSAVGDSRSILQLAEGEAEIESSSLSAAAYKRTLSEDLLMGDEHNFKASYTDDEDDEDHITVTLATTVTNPSWTYAGGDMAGQEVLPEAEDQDLSTDLDSLVNTEGEF